MLNRSMSLLLIFALSHVAASAAPRSVRVTWSELGPLVTGRKVAAVLPDGTHMEGAVREVTAGALVLDGRKGSVSIPRSSLSTLRVKRTGYKWKAIGAAAGLGGGLALGLPIRAYANNEGAGWDGIVAAAIAVPVAVGFLAGYFADRNVMDIMIQPAP